MYRSYSAQFNLQPNQPYIIRVVPGCSGVKKRDEQDTIRLDNLLLPRASSTSAAQTLQTAQSGTQWVQDPQPGAANGSGYIIVPFSDAPLGAYDLQLSLNGSVSYVAVTDGDGTEYAL